MKHKIGAALKYSACAIALSGPVLKPAAAQDSISDSGGSAGVMGEIIVTAQRRAERLQDVPISVSAISGEELDRAQINEIRDLGKIVPNLTVLGTAGIDSMLSIRGIGNNRATQSARAAMIVDDVPYIEQLSLNAGNLFDVDQVEVLRGPQSTLYGLTAEAGLVIIRTHRPTNKFTTQGSVVATADGDYAMTANISGPVISDHLAGSLAGSYSRDQGFIHNVLTNEEYNPETRWSTRAQFAITATDDLTFDVVYAHHQQRNGYGIAYTPVDRVAYNRDFGVSVGPLENAADFGGYGHTDTDEGSTRITWTQDAFTVLSVTAYRSFNGATRLDVDQTPRPFAGAFKFATNAFGNSTFSQEVRLSSPDSSTIKWTGGAFYYERHKNVGSTVGLVAGPIIGFGTEAQQKFHSTSAYGQATAPLVGGVSVTGGVRYENVSDYGIQSVNYANPTANGTNAKLSDSIWLPKVILDYKADTNLLFYASVGRGWLPGGINPTASLASQFTFGSERSWSTEAGFKAGLFDRRVQLNATIFRMDTKGYQEQVRITPITSIVANAAKVRTEGVEGELAAEVSRALSLTASIGYNDAHYVDFIDAAGSKNGKQLPIIPKYNFSIAGTWHVTDAINMRAEWQGSGHFYEYSDAAHRFGAQPGYSILNLKASYAIQPVSLSLFVNNITDRRYFYFVQNVINDGRLFGNPGRPREFGIEVKATF